MTSAEYLDIRDIRVKIESMQQTLSQTAIDINIIKCLLITEFAQKRGMNAQDLVSQLYDIYNKQSKEDSDGETKERS